MKNKILKKIFFRLRSKHLLDCLPDDLYIKLVFYFIFDSRLNLKNPQTLNEKLQWMKLNDRNSLYTTMVDKLEVKEYVKRLIGEEYIIPTLGEWQSFDDIDFGKLPNQFVLKCTHDSGGVVICKDKAILDKNAAKTKIEKSLKNNYYYWGREWPYKNVKPRIIAEQYMSEETGEDLLDYKFQCFNGQVDNILVCLERNSKSGVKYRYFSKDWKFLRYCKGDEKLPSDYTLNKPSKLEEMISIAETLSAGFPEMRVDLYYINGKVYFGEITLFSESGFDKTITPQADREMGSHFELPKKNHQ